MMTIMVGTFGGGWLERVRSGLGGPPGRRLEALREGVEEGDVALEPRAVDEVAAIGHRDRAAPVEPPPAKLVPATT